LLVRSQPERLTKAKVRTTDDELTKLTAAAKELGPQVELYLLLTHETGHRCTAVGRLRWSDIDLEKGWVTWRAEHDKRGIEHSTVLSEELITALKAARRAAARIGDGWVFASPTTPEKPIRRDLLRDWWQRRGAFESFELLPYLLARKCDPPDLRSAGTDTTNGHHAPNDRGVEVV
jgi:integrase